MRDFIDRVFRFNRIILGIEQPQKPSALKEADHRWMVMALREEATELEGSENLADQVDALIDSIIFATGGLFKLGLTNKQVHQCMHAVMYANFQKKAGANPNRPVEGVKDGIKPPGWVPPEAHLKEILSGKQ